MIGGMYEWLIAAVLAVVGAVHDSRPADIADQVSPATTPAVWIDPTTSVEVVGSTWERCYPDRRTGGATGTTQVGAMPCIPTDEDRAWFDANFPEKPPTTGVYYDWQDPCTPHGTTRVGAMPCTP